MKTTRNERIGLIALAAVLAVIVALTLWLGRDSGVEVPVTQDTVRTEQPAAKSDTTKRHKSGKSKKKTKKPSKKPSAPAPTRDPLSQPVN